MKNKDLEVPQSDAADVVHTSVSVALSLIPFVGAGEIFKATITPSLEKRKDAWMQKVAEAIEELQTRKNLTLDDLKDNEEFVTILIDASKIAVGTHLEEKREVLKNILLNTFSQGSTFDLASHYLRIVDQLTEVHMRIIRHMRTESVVYPTLSETKLKDKFYSDLGHIFRQDDEFLPYVELSERIAFTNDLERLGLITSQYVDTDQSMSAQKPYFKLTKFARKFLDFIESPLD